MIWVGLLVWALGCSDDEQSGALPLAVDVRTDYRTPREFSTVRVTVRPDEGDVESADYAATGVERWADGVRVAELDAPDATVLDVTAALLDAAGGEVASRTVRLEGEQRPLGVTVVIPRSCRGVTCPPRADGVLATCIGGSCGDARCSPETPERCGLTECGVDADCGGPACADARCIGGECFAIARDARCAIGERCDATMGCAMLTSCERTGACTLPNAAVTTCLGAACAITTCEAGFGDCNAMAEDGCETTLDTVMHCGACGTVCTPPAHMTAACTAGSCAYACETGWGDCNTMMGDGCEVSLTTTTDCRTCGNACGSAPNASYSCDAMSGCQMSCDSGWYNCNGTESDGCESTDGCCGCGSW